MKTTIEQVREIFELVMKINGTKDRKEEYGKPCVFLNIFGHVSIVEVHVQETGYRDYKDYDKDFRFYLNREYGDDPEECIKYLKSLLKEKENEK